ncbi:major facilitator superfamily domain-containing protein [Kickxella alabastrina]|uniref:major facilitator superfamily domain-containing protein n=1 Tax=Kickxella alabastrina TaxID=61397 RepID=UPI0022207770|nr:major facilitator superfamily domain-containing protein [Kickxella alabastrina]KAI7821648.1 major facilitator superfamily domain-containing protein [Kickxella alabastrina]
MLCGGTTSLFATYNSSFTDLLHFTQYETNLVASLGDYAHYMSAPLFGYLTTRIGPTRVIQAAAVLMFFGYWGLSYMFEQTRGVGHQVGLMSVMFALVGVGSKAAYMATMATAARNFGSSRHKGVAMGVPLSLYGLSTFVFSSIKARWFEADESPRRYLAFMAGVSPRRRRLTLSQPQLQPGGPSAEPEPEPKGALPPPTSALLLFARDPTAWALLLGLICFSGPGLAFINNCGTMVRAMSHTSTLTPSQLNQYRDRIVATQSFCSFSARLATGYLSDLWRTRLRLPRSGLLIVAALLMIYAQTMASQISQLEELHRLAILVGVAMGAAFTLAPTITAETWGAERFGICWGVITLGPAIGGHVCNLIFGAEWDRAQGGLEGENAQCDQACFAPAFLSTARIAWVALGFFALVMALPLMRMRLQRPSAA